jgi:hypothetical protein
MRIVESTTERSDVTVAAFDIGIKNFAFAVKKGSKFTLIRHINLVEDVPLTKTEMNRLKKDELIQMMNDMSIQDETIRRFVAIDKKSTESFCKRKPKIVDALYKHNRRKYPNYNDADLRLFDVMDSYDHVWQECDVFLLERQMLVNRQALKMCHYLEAYLKLRYTGLRTQSGGGPKAAKAGTGKRAPSNPAAAQRPRVINYNASFKTKNLGAPPSQTKPERKLWTVEYVANLLEGQLYEYFQQLPKKDDVADTVCMIQSFTTSKSYL